MTAHVRDIQLMINKCARCDAELRRKRRDTYVVQMHAFAEGACPAHYSGEAAKSAMRALTPPARFFHASSPTN